jgi:hypothetical protein
MKKALFQDKPINKKRNKLPTFSVKAIFLDAKTLMPFFEFEIDSVVGNPDELGKLLENRINRFLKDYENSPTQNKNQNQLYAELVDKYKMPSRKIYPLLDNNYPDYDPKAKRRFRQRLQTYHRRITNTKRATKS